jgi:hypothetical protein
MASDSTRWAAYFAERRDRPLAGHLDAPFPERPGRAAVARSLARFELGESGDGARLKRLAAATGDADYQRAIELFVLEENQHARWLTQLRERFGGEPITSHWSDRAFVLLRHVGGLRLELSVLLTAELIALSYYRVLRLAYPDPALAAVCDRILLDERGHVAFHRATMPAGTPPGWRAFVAATAAVVAWDHRAVLALAGVGRAAFVRETLRRAAKPGRPRHAARHARQTRRAQLPLERPRGRAGLL